MGDTNYNFQKLTPISGVKLDIYKEALDYVFQNDDVRNVGISGAYSAGKSSVIETYKAKNPELKFIHISLSYFQPATQIKETKADQKENVLEGKILNQLIHNIDMDKIPQTNFRVKRQVSTRKTRLISTLLSLFAILSIYILNLGEWRRFVGTMTPEIVKTILSFTTSSLFALLVCVAYAGILVFTIFEIVKLQFNKNLFKTITFQGNTIEIFEKSEESYFDKYLNEVLYLFENSEADVIVFEDMDRYNTNQIFQRLREINNLVNNRKKDNKKRLRFFYLIRDDIFVSKDRTKFFDFIIPIVPILDGSNSYDQFILHFKEGNIYHLFEEHFLQNISLYIDDMRILKNIYNEFVIYNKRITTTEQDPNKLLAIIIYKNLFPRDFSELQLNRGYIYTLFSKKQEFINEEERCLKDDLDRLKKNLESSNKEHLQNNDEVDTIYNPRIENLRGYYRRVKEMESLIQESLSRKENIKNKSAEEQDIIKKQINNLESTIDTLEQKKLHEIINKKNAETIFKVTYTNEIGDVTRFDDIKSSNYFALIKFLIKNGYIDETYPDYMTYFYEHSISRIDKIFLRSITDEDAKEYTYRLKNPGLVVSRLNYADFEKEETINIDLLGYLLAHQSSSNKIKTNRILKQIQEAKNFKFILLYLETKHPIDLFIKSLNKLWPNIFDEILTSSNFTEEQKKSYAIASIYHSDDIDLETMNDKMTLSDYISTSNNFLQIDTPDISRIIKVFNMLNIRFHDIDYNLSDKDLFDAIYQNNLYVINYQMIKLMISVFYKCDNEDDLKHKNYTIIHSKQAEPLQSYINDNMEVYLKTILPYCENSIVDDEEVVIELLNKDDISRELKIEYISSLQITIKCLKDITDISLWSHLLSGSLASYSETNVLNYFFLSGNGLDIILSGFINDHADSFNYNYEAIDQEYGNNSGSKFFNAVVKSLYLNINVYSKILNSLHRYYAAFEIEGISSQKMDVLIKQTIITMSSDVLLFMREHYPEKVVAYIHQNIKLYVEDVISEVDFDFDEMMAVLALDVDDQYKFKVLQYSEESISVFSDNYSEELKAYILQNNYDKNDLTLLLRRYPDEKEKIKRLIESLAEDSIDVIIENEMFVPYSLCKILFSLSSIDHETRLDLFSIALDHFDKTECKAALGLLGLKNYLSIFEGKRPTVPATEVNERILNTFLANNWIVGYDFDKKDDSLYRVRSKRVKLNQSLPDHLL